MALKTEIINVRKSDGWKKISPTGGVTSFTVTLAGSGQLVVWPAAAGQTPDPANEYGHLIARGIADLNKEMSGSGLPVGTEIWVRVPAVSGSDKMAVVFTAW